MRGLHKIFVPALLILVFPVWGQSPVQQLLYDAEDALRSRNPDAGHLITLYERVVRGSPDPASYEHQLALERIGELHNTLAFTGIEEVRRGRAEQFTPRRQHLEAASRAFERAAMGSRRGNPSRCAAMLVRAAEAYSSLDNGEKALGLVLDARALCEKAMAGEAHGAGECVETRKTSLGWLWYIWPRVSPETVDRLLSQVPDEEARQSWTLWRIGQAMTPSHDSGVTAETANIQGAREAVTAATAPSPSTAKPAPIPVQRNPRHFLPVTGILIVLITVLALRFRSQRIKVKTTKG